MNNKGFAITGILYTIFVLFMITIFTSLVIVNFKKQTLSKTVEKLDSDYDLILVSKIDGTEENGNLLKENNGYIRSEDGTAYLAQYDGKYVFQLNQENIGTLICTTYLKKGDLIPTSANNSAITFVPNDCIANYNILIGSTTTTNGKMFLKEVYKFKDSD